MGAVYQAWDDELGVAVALKVIRPEITADPETARDLERRFKRELLLARQVTHKNVVRIHDLGEIDGIKYITMPYIQGNDLAAVLKREGRLPVPRAIAISKQIVAGLQAAHEAGIVHRDLKPANIMLDADDQAVIMDFGIARSAGAGATVAGAVVGTLEYMAPEQAMAQPVDQRADIYAFGLILRDMVLGPRQAARAESAVAELMGRIQGPMPPVRDIDPSLPEALDQLIAACTQPDPAARFQTTAQLAQALDALDLSGRQRTGTAAVVIPATRAVPAVQAPRRAVPVPYLVAAAAVLILVATGWLLRDRILGPRSSPTPGRAVALAVLPFRNASGDASLNWLGASLAEMVRTDVGQSAQLRLVSFERVFQLLRDLHVDPAASELDTETVRRIADFSSADSVVVGRFVKLGDQIRMEATIHDAKRDPVQVTATATNDSDVVRAAQALASSIQQNLSLAPDAVRELRAKAFKPSTQSAQALRYFTEGVQLARQGEQLEAAKRFELSTKEDPKFALAYSKLAQTLSTVGRSAEAEQASRTAVDLSQALPSEEKDLIAASHAQISNDLDRAIEAYERLVQVRPSDLQLRFELAALYEKKGVYNRAQASYEAVLEGDPKFADALLALGRMRIEHGDFKGAVDPLNRALTTAVQLDSRQLKASALQALGIAYKNLGKLDDALKNYQDALAIRKAIDDKRGIAASLNEMAQVYVLQGKTETAWPIYKEAIGLRQGIGDHRGTAILLINLGVSYLNSGHYTEALDNFKAALQIERDLGDESQQARCLSNIGNTYIAQGQYDDARTYLERALELREKAKIPSTLALTLASLGDVSTKLGDYDRAQAQYLRAIQLSRDAGDARNAALASEGMGTLLQQEGRYGAAIDAQAEVVKTFRALQERSSALADILVAYGSALSHAGRSADAQPVLAEAVALARELKNEPLIAQALDAQGNDAYFRGDLKAAIALFEQADQALAHTGNRYYTILVKAHLARTEAEAGRPQAASELRKLKADADALGLKQLSAECSLYAGAALLQARNGLEAQKELNLALDKAEKLGARAVLARTHYLLGEAAQLRGDAAGAAAHFRQAQDALEDVHKEARTDALLDRHDLAPLRQHAAR